MGALDQWEALYIFIELTNQKPAFVFAMFLEDQETGNILALRSARRRQLGMCAMFHLGCFPCLLLRYILSLEALGNGIIFLKSQVDQSTRFCVIWAMWHTRLVFSRPNWFILSFPRKPAAIWTTYTPKNIIFIMACGFPRLLWWYWTLLGCSLLIPWIPSSRASPISSRVPVTTSPEKVVTISKI